MIFLSLIVFAAILVLVFRWVTANRGDRLYRWAWVLFLLGCFLLFWVNGAVGIIGASNNDANMLYNALLALGLLCCLLLRYRPLGLAMVMLIMDALLFLIVLTAWFMDWGSSGAKWPFDAVVATLFFSFLWSAAAVLFYRSHRQQVSEGLH